MKILIERVGKEFAVIDDEDIVLLCEAKYKEKRVTQIEVQPPLGMGFKILTPTPIEYCYWFSESDYNQWLWTKEAKDRVEEALHNF